MLKHCPPQSARRKLPQPCTQMWHHLSVYALLLHDPLLMWLFRYVAQLILYFQLFQFTMHSGTFHSVQCNSLAHGWHQFQLQWILPCHHWLFWGHAWPSCPSPCGWTACLVECVHTVLLCIYNMLSPLVCRQVFGHSTGVLRASGHHVGASVSKLATQCLAHEMDPHDG